MVQIPISGVYTTKTSSHLYYFAMKNIVWLISISILVLNSCGTAASKNDAPALSVHTDTPFLQDHSIKYRLNDDVTLNRVSIDRNGTIQIFSNEGLFRPH